MTFSRDFARVFTTKNNPVKIPEAKTKNPWIESDSRIMKRFIKVNNESHNLWLNLNSFEKIKRKLTVAHIPKNADKKLTFPKVPKGAKELQLTGSKPRI
jgi:hypothetical protein